MTSKKALLTIHVGEERILIPYTVDKTCGDLLQEVRRRTETDGGPLPSALRIRSTDGPRLFEQDLVEDVLLETNVLYAVTQELASPWTTALPNQQDVPLPPFGVKDKDEAPTLAVPAVEEAGDAEERSLGSDQTQKEERVRLEPALPIQGREDYWAGTGHPPLELGERNDQAIPVPPFPTEPEAERRVEELKLVEFSSAEEDEAFDGSWYFQAAPAARPQAACKSPVRASPMDGTAGATRTFAAEDMSGSADAPAQSGGSFIETHSSRRVGWVIEGITQKLKEYPKGSRMVSPEFSAYGIDNLGLVLYPNGNSNAKPGYCSLGLKAPHGCHLRYKLHVRSTEKYTELRQNVTESWGFVDMCKVEDELDKETDTLRLGVEIIDDIDKNETLVEVLPTKIEWTLKNMKSKMKYYKKDIALYSAEFTAGGVEKLRLKLYPNGKKEADAGWCSVYLEAPKGAELRCRLSVGKKSMSFDRLENFGDDSIWGFLTLCSLADEVVDDQVKVCLEVLETKRLDQRLTESEDLYLKSLGAEKRGWLLDELQRVESIRQSSDNGVPSRFRILMMDLPDIAKAVALQRLETLNTDLMSAEATKLKRWIDGLLSIPFGKIQRPIVSIGEGQEAVANYLHRAESELHSAVFGHKEPKEKIVQLLCQWVSNPDSTSLVLGIQGPPGNGKTTLCRKGIAEALGRPFAQISLGGATDASVLEGHSYTYVGSSWGRIVGLIMETGCMNPVMFFDELDKISETPRGEEIAGILTHLTDHSQNNQFTDKYFDGIPLDLSKALFVFSFNDDKKLNSVLRDRLTVVRTKGFNQQDQLQIAQQYLLPDLLANVGMGKKDVLIADAPQGVHDIQYLCEKWGVPRTSAEEGGVRGLRQALEAAVLHVNKLRILHMTNEPSTTKQADAASEEKPEAEASDGASSPSCPADAGTKPAPPDEKVSDASPSCPADAGTKPAPPVSEKVAPAESGSEQRAAPSVPVAPTRPPEASPQPPAAGSAGGAEKAAAVPEAFSICTPRPPEAAPSDAEKPAEEELPKLARAPFDLAFPLTLTKELIDKLLPFDHPVDCGPNLYI